MQNQLYKFSHRIASYIMSVTKGNAPLRGSFEFDRAANLQCQPSLKCVAISIDRSYNP